MTHYRCEFIRLTETRAAGYVQACVRLLEDHKGAGGSAGETCFTSRVRSIDFERGILVTQNNIYTWKPTQ